MQVFPLFFIYRLCVPTVSLTKYTQQAPIINNAPARTNIFICLPPTKCKMPPPTTAANLRNTNGSVEQTQISSHVFTGYGVGQYGEWHCQHRCPSATYQ